MALVTQQARTTDLRAWSTDELRSRFLVEDLFAEGEARFVYTELDRLVIGGVVPREEVALPAVPQLGTRHFLERRELGILNIGGPGRVHTSSGSYAMGPLDCLYVGLGDEKVVFAPDGGQPRFYLVSAPAHKALPAKLVRSGEERVVAVGDELHACQRAIHQFICPGVTESCQLVMGYTELAPGSVWNTMPAHTHERRSEIYLYFNVEGMVVHLMGAPEETRHLIVRNEQAVLSPSWSIHSGAGTAAYRFVWAMGGDNQDFGDMDAVAMDRLK